jgi:hypothetical protein
MPTGLSGLTRLQKRLEAAAAKFADASAAIAARTSAGTKPPSGAFEDVLSKSVAQAPVRGGTPNMWGWSPEAEQYREFAQGPLPYHGAAHLTNFQVYYLAHNNLPLLNMYAAQNQAEDLAQGAQHFAARDFQPATFGRATGAGTPPTA